MKYWKSRIVAERWLVMAAITRNIYAGPLLGVAEPGHLLPAGGGPG